MKRKILLLAVLPALLSVGCDSNMTVPEEPAINASDVAALVSEFAAVAERMSAEVAQAAAEYERTTPKAKAHLSAPMVSGVTYHVPGDFDNLQDAINAAAPGDVIRVHSTHKDLGVVHVTTGGITLDGGGEATLFGHRIQIQGADNVRVTGFDMHMRVWATDSDQVEILGNSFNDTGSAIVLMNGSSYGLVRGNCVSNSAHGVFITTGANENLVEDNVLTHNRSLGVLIQSDSNGNRVIGCNASNNEGWGILILSSHENQIVRCNANANGRHGIQLSESHGNLIAASKANGNERIGIWLDESNDNLVADSHARGNAVCDAVDGGVGNIFLGNNFGSFNC